MFRHFSAVGLGEVGGTMQRMIRVKKACTKNKNFCSIHKISPTLLRGVLALPRACIMACPFNLAEKKFIFFGRTEGQFWIAILFCIVVWLCVESLPATLLQIWEQFIRPHGKIRTAWSVCDRGLGFRTAENLANKNQSFHSAWRTRRIPPWVRLGYIDRSSP